MRKRADETNATEGSHDKVLPVIREEFTDWGMSRHFAERAWYLLFVKKENITDYSILEQQYRVFSYLDSPVVSEGV